MTLGTLKGILDEMIEDYGADHPAVGFIRLTTDEDIANQAMENCDDIEEALAMWLTANGEPD